MKSTGESSRMGPPLAENPLQHGASTPQRRCLACDEPMFREASWVFRCGACNFMISTLLPGTGRGVAGLEPLRQRNFEVVLDRIVELLPESGTLLQQGGDVHLLEVGCAQGWFLKCAASRGMRVEGLEPDIEDTALAPDVNVRAGCFPEALNPNARYRIIVFNDVFEHLPDPVQAITEVWSRLEPGGLAVLNLPSSDGVLFRAARPLNRMGLTGPYERLWQKGMASPHLTYFNPDNLRSFVTRHTELRLVYAGRLLAVSRRGLWKRISSASPKLASLALFPLAWCASFALALCRSDIQLAIFQKGQSSEVGSERPHDPSMALRESRNASANHDSGPV